MSLRNHPSGLCTGVCALLVLGLVPLFAQEPPQASQGGESVSLPSYYYASRRVPPYFGQIGLTPEQRESIYQVRARHFQKIADLEQQIAATRAQMQDDCEAVLTPAQRDLLNQQRRAATARRIKSLDEEEFESNDATSPETKPAS